MHAKKTLANARCYVFLKFEQCHLVSVPIVKLRQEKPGLQHTVTDATMC